MGSAVTFTFAQGASKGHLPHPLHFPFLFLFFLFRGDKSLSREEQMQTPVRGG